MYLSLACLSATGYIRESNEDNFCFLGKILPEMHQSSRVYRKRIPWNYAFTAALFDGMGGEIAGEAASFAAASALQSYPPDTRWSEACVKNAVSTMDVAVCRERERLRARVMGATVAMLAATNGRLWIANVGDSPIYLDDEKGIHQIARLHTDRETMLALGIEGRKPRLTQYLGMSAEGVSIDPYIVELDMRPGSIVLLASDGLSDMLPPAEIHAELLSEEAVEEKVVRLKDQALYAGGVDNVTIIACEIKEGELSQEGMAK